MSDTSDGHLTNPTTVDMGEENTQLPTNTESHQNQIRLSVASSDIVGENDPVRTKEEDINHGNLSLMSNTSDGHLTNPAATGMGEEKPQLLMNTESHQNQIGLLVTSQDAVGRSNDGSTMTAPTMAIASAHQIRLSTASPDDGGSNDDSMTTTLTIAIASPGNQRDMAANEAGQGQEQGRSVQEPKTQRLHSRSLHVYEFLKSAQDDPVWTKEKDSNHDNLSLVSNTSDGHLTNPAAVGMGEEKPQLLTNTESHQNQIRLLATSQDVIGGSNDGSTTTALTMEIASLGNQHETAADEEGQGQEQGRSAQEPKKQRVVWTAELHNRFLQVCEFLNRTQDAVPQKILEMMNEPRLTRANVASHLQKASTSVWKHKHAAIDFQRDATTVPQQCRGSQYTVQ
ncbi:hypothetical protein ABZP36_015913 [Zizania latifolia]